MPNFEDTFGGYTREQLEEAIRSIDPEKNPGDYAAVKAAIARVTMVRAATRYKL